MAEIFSNLLEKFNSNDSHSNNLHSNDSHSNDPDSNTYLDILEIHPNQTSENFHITWNPQTIIHGLNYKKFNEPLYNILLQFLKQYDFLTNHNLQHLDSLGSISSIKQNTIVVSLSGGVDSMVLISILILIKTIIVFEEKYKFDFSIHAIHINYGNRPETDLEEEFLTKWCRNNMVEITVYKMNDYKRHNQIRSEYEEQTKRIRFELYNQIIQENNAIGIFLAHHKNDEQENTFTNVLNGRSLLDLSVMKEQTTKNGINIFRPFIKNNKSDIYNFAHKYSIPYFKDTTPDWSNRGKLRRQIFPLLNDVYSEKYLHNLDKIAKESTELNQIVMSCIIIPFIQNNVKITYIQNVYNKDEGNISPTNNKPIECIKIKISDHYTLPVTFWSYVLMNIFHKANIPMITSKSLNALVYKINTQYNGKLPICKNMMCHLNRNFLLINFN